MNEYVEAVNQGNAKLSMTVQRWREQKPVQRIEGASLDLAWNRYTSLRVRVPQREMQMVPLLALLLDPGQQFMNMIRLIQPGVLRSESQFPEEEHRHQEQEERHPHALEVVHHASLRLVIPGSASHQRRHAQPSQPCGRRDHLRRPRPAE